MNCIACKGTGTAQYTVNIEGRRKVITGDCNDCKGTGEAAFMCGDVVIIAGQSFGTDNHLPYTNTAGKRAICNTDRFEVQESYLSSTHHYPMHYYPLKDILFTGKDIKTGANVCRPLWRSITLQKKNQLFETNKVERI